MNYLEKYETIDKVLSSIRKKDNHYRIVLAQQRIEMLLKQYMELKVKDGANIDESYFKIHNLFELKTISGLTELDGVNYFLNSLTFLYTRARYPYQARIKLDVDIIEEIIQFSNVICYFLIEKLKDYIEGNEGIFVSIKKISDSHLSFVFTSPYDFDMEILHKDINRLFKKLDDNKISSVRF